jgi:hypothetical protein
MNKHWLSRIVLLCMILLSVGLVGAQDIPAGALMLGQPAIGQIPAAGNTISYSYMLTSISQVGLQALSDSASPTITVLRDGQVIAQESNAGAQSIATLTTILDAGVYVVRIGVVQNVPATVITLVQTELPLVVNPLLPAVPVTGDVNAQTPIMVYQFNALPEPAYLYYESIDPLLGASVRLVNLNTGVNAATIDASLTGTRLRLLPDGSSYRVQISMQSNTPITYTLCLVAVSVGSCGTGSGGGSNTLAPTQPPQTTGACTVSPLFAGGTNIRQSASTMAPVVAILLGGTTANVLGIDPFGFWYNVEYNGTVGWAALSALTSNGDCTGLPVNTPPPVPPTPTPTATTTPTPTPTPAVTATPTITPTPVPCLITFSAGELVYTIPFSDPANIYDMVVAGSQLIVIGRYTAAGQEWWQTNYANSWWLNQPGTAGVLSGDCGVIPFIIP